MRLRRYPGFRRFAGLFWTALFLTAGLAGCGRQPGRNLIVPSGRETPETLLTFFGFTKEALNVTAIEQALHDYMEEHPNVTISYESVKGQEYFSILKKRLYSGNGDDLFMVDHDTMLELMDKDYLENLSGLSTISNFAPECLQQMRVNGKILFVPTVISAFGLYCNMDLLRAYEEAPPQNLAEFTAACDHFAGQGVTPVVANNDSSLKTLAIARGMYPLFKKEGRAAVLERLNSDPAALGRSLRPGLELVRTFLDRGYVDGRAALQLSESDGDLREFAKGDAPFLLTGAWAAPRLRELNPNLSFQVHPYPVLEDGGVLVINLDVCISVNARGKHVEQAKELAEYMTQKEVAWRMADSLCSFSPMRGMRLSEDGAVRPLSHCMGNRRSVLGADSGLRFPVWELARIGTAELLEGQEVEAVMAGLQARLAE